LRRIRTPLPLLAPVLEPRGALVRRWLRPGPLL